MRKDLESLTDQQSSLFDKVHAKMENFVTFNQFSKVVESEESLKYELTAMKTEIQQLKATCNEFERLKSFSPVFFHYHLNQDQTTTGVIKFKDEISSSIDKSYNIGTGKFVVPSDGVYFFVLQFYTYKEGTWAIITVNEKEKSRVYGSVKKINLTATLTITLRQNDEVSAFLKEGKAHGSSSAYHCSFQGHRIA